MKALRLWSRGGHQGEPLAPELQPIPPKGQSADIPVERLGGVPEPWLGTNYYARELIQRLFAVADAAKAVYDTSAPQGVRNLEARMTFMRAWERLQEGDE